MSQRRHHYERAFEAYLRLRRIPHICVDEARRALAPEQSSLAVVDPDAGPGLQSLKSFDLVLYGSQRAWIIDVKGRRIARAMGGRPAIREALANRAAGRTDPDHDHALDEPFNPDDVESDAPESHGLFASADDQIMPDADEPAPAGSGPSAPARGRGRGRGRTLADERVVDPLALPARPRRGRLESWVTLDDLTALQRWERLFGPGFAAAFVFVYWCDEQPPEGLFQELACFQDRWYALRVITARDYRQAMKPRSPRWGTVDLPGAAFERLSQPFTPAWIDAAPAPAEP